MVVEGVSGGLLDNVNMYLSIRSLEKEGVTSGAPLRWLHVKARGKISEALIPFGHYRPSVRPALQRTDAGWLASYRIGPGEPVRIRRSDIRVTGEGSQDRALRNAASAAQLGKGEVLVHSGYKKAKSALQSQASAP